MRRSYRGVWSVLWDHHRGECAGAGVLARVVVEDWARAEDHSPPQELAALAMTDGYQLVWSSEFYEPPRQWSKERRARERVRRMRERIEHKWPMFAEQLIAEALASKPAYYAAEDPVYDAGRPGGPDAPGPAGP